MATALDSYMVPAPDDYTLTIGYRTYIESLTKYLRENSGTKTVDIPPETGFLYRFDLTLFLLEQSVPLEDHYLILRMNGMTSVHEIDENLNTLLIPNLALVASLKQVYRTSLSVS